MRGQLRRGSGPYRGDGGAGQRASVAAGGGEGLEEKPSPVGAGQADERVLLDRADRGAGLLALDAGLDPDRGELDRLGAERPQGRGERAGLGAGPGDDDAAAVQRAPLEPGQRLAASDHRPDDDQRRRPDLLAVDGLGEGLQCGHERALARHRAPLDRRRRLARVASRRDQRGGVLGQPPDAHVEDEGAGKGGERHPVESGLRLLGVLVAGYEGHRRGVVAVGHRDSRVGGGGDPGGDPGNDLELDPRLAQRLPLLAAAPEDERIASLEPDDAPALAGGGDQALADLLLGHRGGTGRLADVDQLGLLAGAVERPWRDQAVVEDRVGGRDQLQRARRHQARVPGPRADQVDDARSRAHAIASARSRISRAPAPSRRWASSAPSRVGSPESPSIPIADPLAAVGEPDEGVEPHPAGGQLGPAVDAERAVAGRAEQRDHRALGGQLAQRRPVGDRLDRSQRRLVAVASLQQQRALAGRRRHRLARQREGDLALPSQPPQPGDGEDDRVDAPPPRACAGGCRHCRAALPRRGRAGRRAAGRAGAGSPSPPGPPRARPRGWSRRRPRHRPGPRGRARRRASARRSAPRGRPWPSGRRGRPRRRAAPARPRARSAPCRPARRPTTPRPAPRRRASPPPVLPEPWPVRCRGWRFESR